MGYRRMPSPITNYIAAKERTKSAIDAMQSLVNTISSGVRGIGWWRLARLDGDTLVIPAERIAEKEDVRVDLSTWPSSDALLAAYKECQESHKAAVKVYATLSEEERSLISGPGGS